ncbi:MAG: hypothetical protein ABIJ28_01830 [Patescibacteria group bacterium]
MYNKNYTNYKSKYSSGSYSPKKAVKNFRDLEVYQKSLEGSVFVCNEVANFLEASKRPRADIVKAEVGKSQKGTEGQKGQETKGLAATSDNFGNVIENSIIKNMLQCALSIPHLIAESHSKRFGSSTECLNILDEVMLKCNKMVAYLEQTRDILNTGIETDRFEEEIKKYFHVRQKVLNLQRVWRKYINENQESRIKK